MFAWCSYDVSIMFTWFSHDVHMMFTWCSHDVHTMFTLFSHDVHMLFTRCSHNVHFILTWCSHAVHSNTFNRIYTESNKVWKFQRYILVIEYQSRPILPAPLILLAHLVQLLKYILRKCSNRQKHYDNGLSMSFDFELFACHEFNELSIVIESRSCASHTHEFNSWV